MNRTVTRGLVPLVALAALTALAACSTTVTGTGRPGAAGQATGTGTSSSAAPSETGSFDASGDPHDVWNAAVDASVARLGTVLISGTISGAGVGGAEIVGTYSVDDGGDPVADIEVTTPEGGALKITATGGSAWAVADAAVYTEYGYDAAAAKAADGKTVELTDDDSGLDVYAAFDTLLALCGPDDEDPASVDESGTYAGQDAVVVTDEKYSTETYLDPADGSVLGSVYDDETIDFSYSDKPYSIKAPDASDVITVDGI